MLDNMLAGLSFAPAVLPDFLSVMQDSGIYMLAGAAMAALFMLCLAAGRLGHRFATAILVSHIMIPAISVCLIAVMSLHAVDQVHWMGAELEHLLQQGINQR
ncbi:MAG: hypothetical protein LAT61_02895 [Alcanivorax sp.]|nr:hypothetical protein [Alcanivorax sp.]